VIKKLWYKPWKGDFDFLASEEDIRNCFRLILGRKPNKEEWPGHSSLAGSMLEEVVRGYINSLEFKSRQLLNYDQKIINHSTKFGFDIYLNSKDPLIGKPISLGVVYEEDVTHFFQKHLKKNMVLLDIGANIGWYSLLTAKLLNDHCKIYAFEPFAANTKLLLASKLKNNFKSIKVIQAAAGNEFGTAAFGASGSNGQCRDLGDEVESILASDTVNMIEIDNIVKEKVDLIKIDIEGAEYNALKGSINTIKNSLPIIFSEFTPTAMPSICGITWDHYLNFIVNLGYKISVINKELIDCDQNIDKVYKIFEKEGKDHLDLIFYKK